MNIVSIEFQKVSKQYRYGRGQSDLRETLAQIVHPFSLNSKVVDSSAYSALKDIGFEVRPGEVLGIIGSNGAGKSTILKLAAGIIRPSQGIVITRGQVGSLIELGAGFHPDLTARENVYLYGQIIGMTRREITNRYQEIVEFSELGNFMDMQVKRFSSGMYARLGFSVAAFMDPDILLVDEVLSVGDASFQRKSLEKMLNVVRAGKAVVFISHNLFTVERLCSRIIWLERGHISLVGQPRQVVQAYLNHEAENYVSAGQSPKAGEKGLAIKEIIITGDPTLCGEDISSGEDLYICIRYDVACTLDQARFSLGIGNDKGLLFHANMLLDGHSVSQGPGPGEIHCCFKQIPLMPGAYQLFGEIWGSDGYEVIIRWSEWGRFRVAKANPKFITLAENYSVSHLQADSPIFIPYQWN